MKEGLRWKKGAGGGAGVSLTLRNLPEHPEHRYKAKTD